MFCTGMFNTFFFVPFQMTTEIISWKFPIHKLAVNMGVCWVIIVHVEWYSEHISECTPFMFISTACLSKFGTAYNTYIFRSARIEMSFHLSDGTKACQSKRWLRAPIGVHGGIGLPGQNSSSQKNPIVLNWQTTLVPEMISQTSGKAKYFFILWYFCRLLMDCFWHI